MLDNARIHYACRYTDWADGYQYLSAWAHTDKKEYLAALELQKQIDRTKHDRWNYRREIVAVPFSRWQENIRGLTTKRKVGGAGMAILLVYALSVLPSMVGTWAGLIRLFVLIWIVFRYVDYEGKWRKRITYFQGLIEKTKSLEWWASPDNVFLSGGIYQEWHTAISQSEEVWLEYINGGENPKFQHNGIAGEILALEAFCWIYHEDEQPWLLLHGTLLDKKLDGDLIVICSRGVFLFEVKYWRGRISNQGGQWGHTRSYYEKGGRLINDYVREKDPCEQYLRERRELIRTLEKGPSLRKLSKWVKGGVVFAYPQAEFVIQDPACEWGKPDDWVEKIAASPEIPELSYPVQLRIAEALVRQSEKLEGREIGRKINGVELAKNIIREVNQTVAEIQEKAVIETYGEETREMIEKFEKIILREKTA